MGGDTTRAAPPTIRGYVKKNGLATPPVSATIRARVSSTGTFKMVSGNEGCTQARGPGHLSRSITRPCSARAPLIRLLDHSKVHERLGLANAIDGTQFLRQEPQQRLVVLADGLDQEVVRAGGDDDVVDLGHVGYLLRDGHEPIALAADADHRHLLEAEFERVGDADDLEDAALDEAVRAGPDGRLGDAQIGCDLCERAPAVGLEVLDDSLVEVGHLLA